VATQCLHFVNEKSHSSLEKVLVLHTRSVSVTPRTERSRKSSSLDGWGRRGKRNDRIRRIPRRINRAPRMIEWRFARMRQESDDAGRRARLRQGRFDDMFVSSSRCSSYASSVLFALSTVRLLLGACFLCPPTQSCRRHGILPGKPRGPTKRRLLRAPEPQPSDAGH
jgi:hypothetical protein